MNKSLNFVKLVLKVFGGRVNICLTGLNKEKLIDFSKEIAKVLNYKYVDADEEFAPFLIKAARYPTALVEGLLQENETQLLQQIKKMDKGVISNNHAKIFKNNFSVAVLEEELDEVAKNIQSLLRSKCKFEVLTKQQLLNLVNERF